jgi:DNA-directed RNA polymerase specialized sigma24 family protein
MQKLATTQIKLAHKANITARKIYASLPFGYRFGAMMEIFSDSYAGMKDMLARVLYAEFLKAGVPGMVVGGVPGEELRDKAIEMGRNAYRLIPKGYGSQFARKLLGMVRNKLATEDLTQEFLGELMLMVTEGKLKINGSSAKSLKGAESFTLTFVSRRVIDFLRSRGPRNQEVSISPGGSDEEAPRFEIEDPRSVSNILNRITPGEEKRLIADLGKIDRRNPERPLQYVQFKMEGMTNQQIADEWWPHQQVNKGSMSDWVKRHLPDIKAVFSKYVWSMREVV